MFLDLHVHTEISPCSKLSINDLINNARACGLDGLCITDHDCMDIRFELKEGKQKSGLLVIFGLEYTTFQGDFLLFGPFEHLQPGLEAKELLDLVHRLNGAAIAAHPFRQNRGVTEEILSLSNYSALEQINGRNNSRENQQAINWLQQNPRPATGGSDAHSLAELGRVKTFFPFNSISSRTEFVQALRNGRFYPIKKQSHPKILKDKLYRNHQIYNHITTSFHKIT